MESNIEFLLEEGNRCLKCKHEPCKKACPIGTSIPEVIQLFQKEEYKKAGEILFNNNPMSLVCSLICPFENQCMGSCVRGIKGEPIDFPKIENYIMKEYLKITSFEKNISNGKKIAIVGGGPGALTAGILLRKNNYEVTIFDNHEKLGGMLRYGIPDFRLPKENIDLLEKKVIELGIIFKGNSSLEENDILNLKKDYNGVLIATGTWFPKKLNIEGVENPNTLYAIDYLKNNIDLGKNKKVVVIGAGNVAMDVARTAKRQGNEVIIAYRRPLEDSPATKLEIREAKEDGVEFLTYVSPKKILENGIILEKTYYDENKKLKTLENSEFILECDYIILALSQVAQYPMEVLKEKGITEENGFFFCGDILTGPETVVKAAVTGKESVMKIEALI
ncbi:FAD-dependent oxidoreductase [Cetobacterium ceti]